LELDIHKTYSYRAHQVPFRNNFSKIQNKRVLLVGDAAGLTDPLTGEGIYYAINSGIIAAETTDVYFQNKLSGSLQYEKRINEEIMPDLIAVDQLQQMFFRMLYIFHRQIRTNDRLWNAFAKVLVGEKEYQSFVKAFGRFQFLYPFLYQLAKKMQDIRIKRFKEINIPNQKTGSTL